MFEANFQTILTAPLRMFLMGAVGYYLIKRRIIPEHILNVLNDLLVYLFLPCLILHDFFEKFTFIAYGNWWVFPLLGIAVSMAGLLVGHLFSFLLKNKEKKSQFLSLCAFQNSGYIPLVIAEAIFSAQDAEQMYMYIFLFLVGFNFLVWSLGAKLISGQTRSVVSVRDFYNPPVLATIVSLVMIFVGLHHFIPRVVLDSLGSFGNCTMPLAILVVGGSLATIKIDEKLYLRDVALAVVIKLFVFPALILTGLFFLGIKSLLGLLLIIQAAVPSAVTLTVIAKYYKQEETFINQTIFYSHVIGLITFPFFLILYQRLVG
jgi:predicted permease